MQRFVKLRPLLKYTEFLLLKLALFLVKIMSMRSASNLGARLGVWIAPYLKAYKYAICNIAHAFPSMDQNRVRDVARQSFVHFARTCFEFPHVHATPWKVLSKSVEVRSTFDLNECRSGCVAVSAHTGNWEVSLRYLEHAGLKQSVVYMPFTNASTNALMTPIRGSAIVQIPKNNMRAIVRAIADHRCICFLCDQKLLGGVEIDFFGRPALTTTAPAKLALQYELPLILVRSVRTSNLGFVVEISKLEFSTSQEGTKKINEAFERWATECPEQWFWAHRRYGREFYTHST